MPAVVVAAAEVIGGALATGLGGSALAVAVGAAVEAAFVGAVVGAAMGAAVSAIKGDNILDGALNGAMVGGVSGGVLNIIGNALGTSVTAAETGAAEGVSQGAVETAVPQAGAESAMSIGEPAINTVTRGGGLLAEPAAITPGAAASAPIAGGATAGSRGLLASIGNFIESNPKTASLVGKTIGGAAEGLLESRSQDKVLEAAMERDRLNRESLQVGGLADINLNRQTPTITGYRQLPQYRWDPQKQALVKVT